MEGKDLPVSFGEWLKRRRKALDLTQEELAQRSGCSVFALRKIETGERRPSKQLAGLLASALEIPLKDHGTFVKVARGDLNLERLGLFSRVSAGEPTLAPGPVHPPSHLPIAPTPLIGRDAELTSLVRLLSDHRCRLLTLVGLGGMGKTRLAIEVANHFDGVFPDGVHFIPLASLNSPAFLVPAIADVLGVAFQGQLEPRFQLLNYLRSKQALLVLDNAEHLLDGVGLFSEVLERAAGMRLLVTSRERLSLQGEWVFEIQGLPVPPVDQPGGAEEYSSVALFVQNARRAQAGFVLSSDEHPSVARICQMVEGMPLGIELAAAWVSILSCQEVADEIERNLDFLSTSMRDIPERQRSLRAVFEHSWSLLSDDERRVLSCLSIFRGGFDRQSAAFVAGATLSSLSALVSKSLVHRTESGRYDLHEVVRQYAYARLSEDPHYEATCDRHSDFYLELLRDREKALKGAAQEEALRELTDEIDDLRAAWSWAVERERFSPLGGALRCAGYLFDIRGWLWEGIEQFEQVIQALRAKTGDEGLQKVLGQALAQQGVLYFRQGQHERALALFEESLAVLRPFGDPGLLPDPLIFSGVVTFLSGEFERAQTLIAEGLACAQAAGDSWFDALGLFNLGYVDSLQGRYDKAYEQMLAGIDLWRILGDPRLTAMGLNFISPTTISLGRYEEAQAFLRESLALCTQVGDRWGIGTAYRHLGLAALAQGNLPEAQSLIQKGLEPFTELGARWDVVQSLIYLGETAAAAGDTAEAGRIFLEALPVAVEVMALPLELDILLGLALLKAGAGEYEEALMLSRLVMNHNASTYVARQRAESLTLDLESRLTDQQIQSSWQRSGDHSLETIVEILLQREG